MNKKDQRTAELMKELVTTYFNVIKKNVKDSVPKAIMLFLVNRTVDSVNATLVSKIFKDVSNLEDLIAEDSALVAQRKAAKHKLETLEKALAVLNEVQFM